MMRLGSAIRLGPEIARRAVSYLSGARTAGGPVLPELTNREREVLDLVARGHDNLTIARRFGRQP
ncbi:MAG: LuxR C-terminal-related transcriptional regulator [Egibacteraceae bacterium]